MSAAPRVGAIQSAAPGRPKQARAPSGLSIAAPSLPAQAWTMRRSAASRCAAACKASEGRAAPRVGAIQSAAPGRPKQARAPSGGSGGRAAPRVGAIP
jgi:hypothetical protein